MPESDPSEPAAADRALARTGSRSAEASEVAFVAGTSTRFLGAHLPPALRTRPLIFVLGPAGVGKSSVASRILEAPVVVLEGEELQGAVNDWARRRQWSRRLSECHSLLLEGPCFLEQRPGLSAALGTLLRERVARGLRTAVTEAQDGSPLLPLMSAVPLERRATVQLRFPEGKGRRRFALQVCEELGLEAALARRVAGLDPWTWAAARAGLEALRAPTGQP